MQTWAKKVAGELDGILKKAKQDLERSMRAPVSEEKIIEEAWLWCAVEDLKQKKEYQGQTVIACGLA